MYLPNPTFAPPPRTLSKSLTPRRTLQTPDHARKIELLRHLMSGYVNSKVLDTLSEHANALASTAVASLEDEADQPSHFPFLPMLSDVVLTVPRHHGRYTEQTSDSICFVAFRLVLCFCCRVALVTAGCSKIKLPFGFVRCNSLQGHLGPLGSVWPSSPDTFR